MSTTAVSARTAWRCALSPAVARAAILCGVGAGVAMAALADTGLADTGTVQAVAQAGDELTRLLRGMAVLKAMLSAGVVAAVLWRLGAAVSLAWLAGYVVAGAAMAAGPVLIWGMAHIVSGSLLTHAGLLGGALLLWRDPAMAQRLGAAIALRRARHARDRSGTLA